MDVGRGRTLFFTRKILLNIFSLVIMILAELNESGILGESFPLTAVSNGLLWITAVLCVVSGVIYVKQSVKLIDFSK